MLSDCSVINSYFLDYWVGVLDMSTKVDSVKDSLKFLGAWGCSFFCRFLIFWPQHIGSCSPARD